MPLLPLLTLLLACEGSEPAAPTVLLAQGGEEGLVVVVADDWDGRWQIELFAEDDFVPTADLFGSDGLTAGEAFFVPAARTGGEVQLTRVRITDGATRQTDGVAPVVAQLTHTAEDAVYWPGEPLTATVEDLTGTLESVPLRGTWTLLERAVGADEPEQTALTAGESVSLPASIELTAPEHTARVGLSLSLSVAALRPSGDSVEVPVATDTVQLGVVDAAELYWGDLHVHTNLSNDGCEMPNQFCDSRDGVPASDAIDIAADNGLDFFALTEHAEWEVFAPDGGEDYDIWAEQQELALSSSDTLLLVGYEWTNNKEITDLESTFPGGHKTVLFRDAEVCDRYRVSASDERESVRKLTRATYIGWHEPLAKEPVQLFSALEDAQASCGESPVMTFFHHPALEKPQPVDFEASGNAPDPRFERLVEIYSEHGCSECIDTTADDCDFQLNENYEYVVRGAVQTALKNGYQLGFVGGTDAHDGRAGSLDDGPSYHGPLGTTPPADTGDPSYLNLQFAPGALTGVYLEHGLARTDLFDAMWDRATLATSGPRPRASAFALGHDGALYRSGQVLPQSAMPVTLLARVEDEDFTLDGIRLVHADGDIEAESTDGLLSVTTAISERDALYWRIVGTWGGVDARVWISPVFGGVE